MKKSINIIRYAIGVIIILINVLTLPQIYGFFGILVGTSLLPNIYNILGNINFLEKYIKKISIFLPIILTICWFIFIPVETKLKIIEINDNMEVIPVNQDHLISFTTNLSQINLDEYEFTSSDNNIATVKNGVISGIKEGEVIITIKGENGVSASANYIVKYIDIENIKLIGNNKIKVGASEKINANILPKKASDSIEKWESSNPEVISVDNDGNITANQKGNTTITVVTKKGKKQSININAYIEIDTLELSESSLKIENGKKVQLNFKVFPTEADTEGIMWKSSNPSIATVENGNITALKEGKATITVESLNGKKASIEIEVFEIKPESISINKNNISLYLGKSTVVNAEIYPSNTSNKIIEWSSSNWSIATVENGKITAKGKGKAIITAKTTNGKSAQVEVTVTEKSPIKINYFKYTIDYVCGVEWNFSITNNSGKTINYITLKWYNYNSIDDYVYDSISGKNYVQIKYTGPLYSGASTGGKRNITKFYNCSYKKSKLSEIIIEYADGTVQRIYAYDMLYYSDLY